MILKNQTENWRKIRSVNADCASFASLVALPQSPFLTYVSTGSYDTGAEGSGTRSGGLIYSPGAIHFPLEVSLSPYLVGSDNATMYMDAIGWRPTDLGKPTEIWTPVTLFEALCTGSGFVGLANRAVIATERFCDTIALTSLKGTQGTNIDVMSPADNTPGYITLKTRGFPIVEVRFNLNSSATGCNALWARL